MSAIIDTTPQCRKVQVTVNALPCIQADGSSMNQLSISDKLVNHLVQAYQPMKISQYGKIDKREKKIPDINSMTSKEDMSDTC